MGRHAAPGSDGSQPEATPAGGRRRADERRNATEPADRSARELPSDADVRRSSAPAARSVGPESDGAMTMPRTSRADRRREGLLPTGEDPMLRRPPARPAGGPPPGAGRRRTDADPTVAPGRPPETGERRRPPALPVPAAQSPGRPTPAAPSSGRPSPAPRPAVSGPMTAAAPGAGAAGRVQPPSARRDLGTPARGATAVGAPAGGRPVAGPDAAPHTTGMPSWAAEPGPPTPPPHDVTQRVSGAVPAESAWSAPALAAPAGPATPPRAVHTPARPARPGPPAAAAPVREMPARVTPAAAAPEPVADPEPARNRVDVPVGGRAAARLERQAAEAARKKSGRRNGPPATPAGPAQSRPGREAEPAAERRRMPRHLVQGLVAVVVIAVGVLGFWSFTSPGAEETSAQTPITSSAPATSSAAAPVQESVAPTAEVTPPPVGPVRAPITVLNSTSVNGLAADIGDQFTAGGWEVATTGKSPVQDVATTTVYFTEGDTVQQQAAAQLIEQFPDISGPVPRYFELPDQPTPGLVVVATGNWQP